ncbi:hypothetical protein B0A50_01951 [Salinomyces thailandicus]|uniref:Uncharacterized protein n=1 Tax=Salinomyces thailandicus TaxID=706561 RepID=A0A4U0U6Z9_9PEZI|nr:hypothetical protein B0A50_01951 [Salinomyces thailandica]
MAPFKNPYFQWEEAPNAPIQRQGFTSLTEAKNKTQLVGYLCLEPANNFTLRKWIAFGLNVKYYVRLHELDKDLNLNLGKSTWERALAWIRTVENVSEEDEIVEEQETTGDQTAMEHAYFKGNVASAKEAYSDDDAKYLACIIIHWRNEILDFENGFSSEEMRSSWARSFQDYKEIKPATPFPAAFHVPILDTSEIPAGLRDPCNDLPQEIDYERYNRLWNQYMFLKKTIGPPSKWSPDSVGVDNDAEASKKTKKGDNSGRRGQNKAEQTFFSVGKKDTLNIPKVKKPRWWKKGCNSPTSPEKDDDPQQAARDFVDLCFHPVEDYPDVPCFYKFIVDDERDRALLNERYSANRKTREPTRKIPLDKKHRGPHPGEYPESGPWRQYFRNTWTLSRYRFEIYEITMHLYEEGAEESFDYQPIYRYNLNLSRKEILESLDTWKDETASVMFEITILSTEDDVIDETGLLFVRDRYYEPTNGWLEPQPKDTMDAEAENDKDDGDTVAPDEDHDQSQEPVITPYPPPPLDNSSSAPLGGSPPLSSKSTPSFQLGNISPLQPRGDLLPIWRETSEGHAGTNSQTNGSLPHELTIATIHDDGTKSPTPPPADDDWWKYKELNNEDLQRHLQETDGCPDAEFTEKLLADMILSRLESGPAQLEELADVKW